MSGDTQGRNQGSRGAHLIFLPLRVTALCCQMFCVLKSLISYTSPGLVLSVWFF